MFSTAETVASVPADESSPFLECVRSFCGRLPGAFDSAEFVRSFGVFFAPLDGSHARFFPVDFTPCFARPLFTFRVLGVPFVIGSLPLRVVRGSPLLRALFDLLRVFGATLRSAL